MGAPRKDEASVVGTRKNQSHKDDISSQNLDGRSRGKKNKASSRGVLGIRCQIPEDCVYPPHRSTRSSLIYPWRRT
ncbi:hypothetical protein BJX62DRAFT_213859 [Aspergillus germanicus]